MILWENRIASISSVIFATGLIYNLMASNLFEPKYLFWQFEWCGLFLVFAFAGMMMIYNCRIIREEDDSSTEPEIGGGAGGNNNNVEPDGGESEDGGVRPNVKPEVTAVKFENESEIGNGDDEERQELASESIEQSEVKNDIETESKTDTELSVEGKEQVKESTVLPTVVLIVGVFLASGILFLLYKKRRIG